MAKPTTGISNKWVRVAKSCLGDKNGKHCHWCKHIKHDDGSSTCENPKSKFADGGRIRSWDGLFCAKKCELFELEDFYKSDINFEKTFYGKTNDTKR